LEKRLKMGGEEMRISRSQEILLEIYDESVTPLWNQFLQACSKFDKFYLAKRFDLRTASHATIDELNASERIREFIFLETKRIIFHYVFRSFKNSVSEEIDYWSRLYIDFSLNDGYSV